MTDKPAAEPAEKPAPVEYEAIPLTASEQKTHDAMTPAEKKAFEEMSGDDQKALLDRASAPMVSIGCSLASGMSIEVKGKTYLLKGPDLTKKQKFGMASIPEAAWDAWITEHADFAPVVSGAIVGPAPKVAPKDAERQPTPREQAKLKPAT